MIGWCPMLHCGIAHLVLDTSLITSSAVRIVFFSSFRIESNRIVIVGLKSHHSSKYLLSKFNCFYGTALLWFLL